MEKLPFSKADDYFKTRPYQSQIGALCSNQSAPIESRDVLFERERELKDLHKEQVPRPELWYEATRALSRVLSVKCVEHVFYLSLTTFSLFSSFVYSCLSKEQFFISTAENKMK